MNNWQKMLRLATVRQAGSVDPSNRVAPLLAGTAFSLSVHPLSSPSSLLLPHLPPAGRSHLRLPGASGNLELRAQELEFCPQLCSSDNSWSREQAVLAARISDLVLTGEETSRLAPQALPE